MEHETTTFYQHESFDQVGQHNTANAQETAATAEELASQARHLNHLLSSFKLDSREYTKISASLGPGQKQANPHQTSIPAARAKAPQPAASVSNWGEVEQPQIALDDNEFGKY